MTAGEQRARLRSPALTSLALAGPELMTILTLFDVRVPVPSLPSIEASSVYSLPGVSTCSHANVSVLPGASVLVPAGDRCSQPASLGTPNATMTRPVFLTTISYWTVCPTAAVNPSVA